MTDTEASAQAVLPGRNGRGQGTLQTILALVLLFTLGACSQSAPPETTGPTGPDAATWNWTTVGSSDVGASVEIRDSTSGQSVVVSGGGTDIFGTSDSFVYTYTKLAANGVLEAKLEDFVAPNQWSKAGIMIREGLDPSARNLLLLVSGQMGAVFQARSVSGASTQVIGYDPSVSANAAWLRMRRSGDQVIAELSKNGQNWVRFSTHTFASTGSLLIGFAVAANSSTASSVAMATFSDVQLADTDTAAPQPPQGPETPSQPIPPTPIPSPVPEYPDAVRGFTPPPATLYVSPSGLASNSGRNASDPTSIRRAIELAGPGDVVYLRGGTYPINAIFSKSGARDNPIIWTSHPGEWAVFDGSGLARGVASDHVWVTGNWNFIANIEVRNSPQQGILVSGANNNTLFGVITHGNHGSGIQLMDSNNNRLENIITYDNFDSANTRGQTGQDADGIGISSGDGNVIYNCVSYFNSDDGVDLWKSTNSLIDGCISFSNGRGAYGNGNGFKLGGPVVNNSTIQRSIAFANKAAGITSNGGQQISIVNNTSFGNSGSNFQGSTSSTFRNNISESGRVNQNGASGQNNSWDLGLQASGFASIDPANPLFLSLSATSPARGAGTPNVSVPYAGSAPDLGALQFPQTWAERLGNQLFDMEEAIGRTR